MTDYPTADNNRSSETHLYLKFLKKLGHIAENRAAKLQNEPINDYFSYYTVSKFHLFWLVFQLKALHFLLSKNLPIQAAELIRSIWEAKVNLKYIGQQSLERSRAFVYFFLKELHNLKEQCENGNLYLPQAFKNFAFSTDIENFANEHWKKQLFQRAEDVDLKEEYRSIYKIFSWSAHAEMFALAGHRKAGNNKSDPCGMQDFVISFPATALREAWEILKELNKSLAILSVSKIDKNEKELTDLLKSFYEKRIEFTEKNLPNLIQSFSQMIQSEIARQEPNKLDLDPTGSLKATTSE